jgi:hypothetical protein
MVNHSIFLGGEMNSKTYNSFFFDQLVGGSTRSALEVVKVVKDLVNPKSVIDVGCGIGTWLKVWMDSGVEHISGIDGHYILPEQLMIPPEYFKQMDLSSPTQLASRYKLTDLKRSTESSDRFDLAQSLEVGEHLPHEVASALVGFLCSLAPVVLFGAAIPYQSGSEHINEQWPRYWAELFLQKGYVAIDAIRDRVWNNPNIEAWYRQNTLIYVEKEHLKTLERLRDLSVIAPQDVLPKVHPWLWIDRNEQPLLLEKLLAMLPRSTFQFFVRAKRKVKRTLAK